MACSAAERLRLCLATRGAAFWQGFLAYRFAPAALSPAAAATLKPDFPPWLQEIILHCLEVDPERRFSTAAQVAFDLQRTSTINRARDAHVRCAFLDSDTSYILGRRSARYGRESPGIGASSSWLRSRSRK